MPTEHKDSSGGKAERHFIAERNLSQEDWEIMYREWEKIKNDETFYTQPVLLVWDLKVCFINKENELQLDEQFLNRAMAKLKYWIHAYESSEGADWLEVLKLAVAIRTLFPEVAASELIDERSWEKIKKLEKIYKDRILASAEEERNPHDMSPESAFLEEASQAGGFFNNYLEMATARKVLKQGEDVFASSQEKNLLWQFGLRKRKQIEKGGVFWDHYADAVIQLATLFPERVNPGLVSEKAWRGMQKRLQEGRERQDPFLIASIARKMETLSAMLEESRN